MSAAVKCQHCQDSGMSPGSYDYDCVQCGAAVERTALELWADDNVGPHGVGQRGLWAIYQSGKAAGAAQAVPEGWRVVPVKPDDNMAYFGARSIINGIEQNRNESWAKEVRRVYTTMIHLAPEVP